MSTEEFDTEAGGKGPGELRGSLQEFESVQLALRVDGRFSSIQKFFKKILIAIKLETLLHLFHSVLQFPSASSLLDRQDVYVSLTNTRRTWLLDHLPST